MRNIPLELSEGTISRLGIEAHRRSTRILIERRAGICTSNIQSLAPQHLGEDAARGVTVLKFVLPQFHNVGGILEQSRLWLQGAVHSVIVRVLPRFGYAVDAVVDKLLGECLGFFFESVVPVDGDEFAPEFGVILAAHVVV